MELGLTEDVPFAFSALFDRIEHPPEGRDGGQPGAAGRLSLGSGPDLAGKGTQTIPKGDRVVIEMPGGGGLGDPKSREVEKVVDDVRSGLVSCAVARECYGVFIDDSDNLDVRATNLARQRVGE
jgi:N-methylhydantoinase B